MKKHLQKQLDELESKVHCFEIPYLEYLSEKERIEKELEKLK